VSANHPVDLLSLLCTRLERLSVDSHLARKASGLRGNILKVLEEVDAGHSIAAWRLDLLINSAFEILRQAAEEIPYRETVNKPVK
jgi:hypothetical protein